MAVTSLKRSGVFSLVKYDSLLAGNTAWNPAGFESIATVTGNGSSSTLTFSSIPSDYTSLQIRGIGRSAGSTIAATLTFNGGAVGDYSRHELRGNGSAAGASGGSSATSITVLRIAVSSSTASTMGVGVIDIHDYASTTRYKTVRAFTGMDMNTSSTTYQVQMLSGVWMSTAAITSITLEVADFTAWTSQTTFALYGIKGA